MPQTNVIILFSTLIFSRRISDSRLVLTWANVEQDLDLDSHMKIPSSKCKDVWYGARECRDGTLEVRLDIHASETTTIAKSDRGLLGMRCIFLSILNSHHHATTIHGREIFLFRAYRYER